MFRNICCLVVVLACSTGLNAAILKTEPFTYTNGNLVANSGGNWTNLSGTGTFLQVASNEVAGLSHGSGSREDATTVFNASNITTGSIVTKFEVDIVTAPTAGADYFFALHPAATSDFRGRVFLSLPSPAAAGAYRIGLENDGGSTTILTSNLTASTITIMLSVDVATNVSKLWVGTDPTLFVEASPTLTDSVVPGTLISGFSRAALRQGTGITSTNSINIDNLVIGQTFAEVVPEPTSLGFIGLAGLSLIARRRR